MDRPDDASCGAPGVVSALVAELLKRCTFAPPGTRVTCAVSGGADSAALLALAVEAGCGVTAIHVDHGLREGSALEATAVAELAERFGATFEARRIDVADGPNLEARARAARHAALPPDVLWGHTADDQAETVLINLLRGAGVAGVTGIRDRARHPILSLRRFETEAVCNEYGIEPFADPSNSDPRFQRNRIRAEVLPLLGDVAGRDVVPLLARHAELAADTQTVIDDLSAALDPTDTQALRTVPRPIAAAALRRWFQEESGEAYPPGAQAMERIAAVVAGDVVACEVSGGWRVSRSGGRLHLAGIHASPGCTHTPHRF